MPTACTQQHSLAFQPPYLAGVSLLCLSQPLCGSHISCFTGWTHQVLHVTIVVQDERRRQYLGRLPHLQPHYCGPVSIDELDTSAPIFATFTNAAPVYVEQLLNWAFHLRELQLPHVVVCLDDESEDIALSNGIPYVTVQNKTTSEDVRNDHKTFRAMVSRKARPLPHGSCFLICHLSHDLECSLTKLKAIQKPANGLPQDQSNLYK